MREFITVCEESARAGGRVLLDWRGRFSVREKAPADLVTDADVASQEAIRAVLLGAFPDHHFLGEEDTPDSSARLEAAGFDDESPPYCWVVDPLDGTTNYVHGMPAYSVSVALVQDGRVLTGTVYNPVSDECFSAADGQGAFLNGQKLETSRVESLEEGLVAVSFAAKMPRNSPDIDRFLEVLHACQAVRRLGSAALNLCHVAAGQLDAYWATSVKPWDVAAGVLLVQEAGGIVTGLDGGPFDLANPRLAASATRPLHEEFVATLARSRP